MLDRLRRHGYAGSPVIAPRRGVSLHAMVVGAGYERVTSPSYDWHGMRRGRAPVALLQYTIRGRGMLNYGGVDRVVEAGRAMVLHWPHEHRYWLPAGWEWEHFFLCFNGRELLRLWQVVEDRCGGILEIPEDSPVLQRAVDLTLAILEGRMNDPFVSSAKAYALVMEMLSQVQGGGRGGSDLPEQVQAALRFGLAHLADDIGVEDLADAGGCSRAHFSRIFRDAVGQSPGAWLIGERLALAAKLLADQALSLQDVADRSGFSDANYFGKAFRRVYGMAPGAYRKAGLY